MKIHWLLCGGINIPSSRIHGINVHKELLNKGFNSIISHSPKFYTKDLIWREFFIKCFLLGLSSRDVVVVQKLEGNNTIKLLEGVCKIGASIVLVDCDLPLKSKVAKYANIIVCPSESLANMYRELGFQNVNVIYDAVEIFKKPIKRDIVNRKLIWFGKSGLGKWEKIMAFRKENLPLITTKWKLFTLSDHEQVDYKWDIKTFAEIISDHDLTIIPIDKSETNLVKSANRCTQSMALGVPVLSNFIDSYAEVVQNNKNGLVSDNFEDWKEFLKKCENPEFLSELKQRAYNDSLRFSIEKIVWDWIQILGLKQSKLSQREKIENFFFFSFIMRKVASSF